MEEMLWNDILALKTSDCYCYFLQQLGMTKRDWGEAPKTFWNHTFSILWKCIFDKDKMLKREHLVHLLKRAGSRPPGAPSCMPGYTV